MLGFLQVVVMLSGRWVVDALTPTCMLLTRWNTQAGVFYCSICNQMLSFLARRTFPAPALYISDSASPISPAPPCFFSAQQLFHGN